MAISQSRLPAAIEAVTRGSRVVSLSNTFDASVMACTRRYPTPDLRQKELFAQMGRLVKLLREVDASGTIGPELRADVTRFIEHQHALDLSESLTFLRTQLWVNRHIYQCTRDIMRARRQIVDKNYFIGGAVSKGVPPAEHGRCLWA